MNSRMLRPTILSVSLLTIMASAAVSPALAKISQAFPDVSRTVIKLILTLPSLLIIPFSLLSGWLTSRMKKRSILLIGLVVYFIAGVGGGFARNITELLIIRGILGIGIGLIMPLSTTLIADFFEGQARTKMMGLSGSVTNVGGVLFLSASGWLACYSWRLSFGVYSLAVVTFIMVASWLPEPPQTQKAGRSSKPELPMGIVACAVLGILMMIAFYAVPTNLALFIEDERQVFISEEPLFESKEDLQQHLEKGTVSEVLHEAFRRNGISLSSAASIRVEEPSRRWAVIDKNKEYPVKKEGDTLTIHTERLGRPALAGYALSTMTLSGAIAGAVLANIFKLFGSYSVPVAIGLMGTGFGLLGYASSMLMVFIAVPFIGLGAGIMMPSLLLRVPKLVSESSRAFAMAVVGSAIFFGQFLSPIALKAVAAISGRDTFRFRFGFLAVCLAISAVIGLVIVIRGRMMGKIPHTPVKAKEEK